MSIADDALRNLWLELGGEPEALQHLILTGEDPVLPSTFPIGTAASVTTAAAALAGAEFWRARGGAAQRVSVDMRAAGMAFRSERYLRIDGASQREPFGPIGGLYRCRDGWVQIHAGFPHHRDIALKVLGCAGDRDAVAAALAGWSALDFESAVTDTGGCAAAVRTPEDWAGNPHAAEILSQPLIAVEDLGGATPECAPLGPRPLSGVRVLDLTRVIAGPVCGRTLAEHGADVLRIASPNLPSRPDLVIDTGHGKRSAWVDLDTDDGRATLWALIRQADVLVQSYRPGALAARGFGPEQVAAERPGIVYVSLSAYGERGPWAGKRGFDSLVQCVTGIAREEADAFGDDAPRHLPCQALDHATGYLAAFGAMIGLLRRARGRRRYACPAVARPDRRLAVRSRTRRRRGRARSQHRRHKRSHADDPIPGRRAPPRPPSRHPVGNAAPLGSASGPAGQRQPGLAGSGLTVASPSRLRADDLPWVHQVVGVEGSLDGAHEVDPVAVLCVEELNLAVADAVLSGAGAVHGDGAGDQALIERRGARDFVRIVRVEHHVDMEVAIADMADDRRQQPLLLDVLAGLGDALRQPRDRHADVGRPGARAGPERHVGVVRVMACLPQRRALLGAGSPSRSWRRRTRAAMAWTASACSLTPASVPWKLEEKVRP